MEPTNSNFDTQTTNIESTETVTPITLSETTENKNVFVENKYENLFDTEAKLEIFKGFGFWVKLVAIFQFINAGLFILVGIPLLLAFGAGLFYIAFGVLYVFWGIWLLSAANSSYQLSNNLRDREAQTNIINVFSKLRNVYKAQGILIIVSIITTILLVASLIVIALITNFDTRNINIEDAIGTRGLNIINLQNNLNFK